MDPAHESLNENVYNELWQCWYHEPSLQQIRKTMVQQCISDIEVSMTWTERDSNGGTRDAQSTTENQLLIEKRLRNTLKHNIGAIVDWLCVVGVCPLAEIVKRAKI